MYKLRDIDDIGNAALLAQQVTYHTHDKLSHYFIHRYHSLLLHDPWQESAASVVLVTRLREHT